MAAGIRELLRAGPIRFVLAEIDRPVHWLELDESFTFWKAKLRDHVCEGERFYLENYPGGYCFAASESELPTTERVVVLERRH